MAKKTSFFALLAKNIKIIFCCYHVQISLTMLQQTQTDIFHTKCYKIHCGVRLHGQNVCYVIFCNIAPKHWIYICTWTQGIATHFIFVYDFIVIGNMLVNVFFAVEGHIILKIWLILRI